MSEDKRPLLAGDDNEPALREDKPPFGLDRAKWNRIKVRLVIGGALIASICAFVILTRRTDTRDPHQLNGQTLAPFYEVATETYGCEPGETISPAEPIYVGVHQGIAAGPALVDCASPAQCESVSLRDPRLRPPAVFRGPEEEVEWRNWLGNAVVLEEEGDRRSGTTRRQWRTDDRCHLVERREEFAISGETLSQSVEILHGSRECTTYEEPEVQCVERRVRELRATRR